MCSQDIASKVLSREKSCDLPWDKWNAPRREVCFESCKGSCVVSRYRSSGSATFSALLQKCSKTHTISNYTVYRLYRLWWTDIYVSVYSRPLNSMGLNCMGPPHADLFQCMSVRTLGCCHGCAGLAVELCADFWLCGDCASQLQGFMGQLYTHIDVCDYTYKYTHNVYAVQNGLILRMFKVC